MKAFAAIFLGRAYIQKCQLVPPGMGRRRGDHLVAEGANPIRKQAADVHVGRGDERPG
jgi:hypothetical protein